MRLPLALIGLVLAYPVWAQSFTSEQDCFNAGYDLCYSRGYGTWEGKGSYRQEQAELYNYPSSGLTLHGNEQGILYSTPAPKRNWNLYIVGTTAETISLTPHLYKQECEALMSALDHLKPTNKKMDCIETPK